MSYEYRSYWSSIHKKERGQLSAVGYEALGEGFNQVAYRRRRRALRVFLERVALPRGAVCLEGGCGIGAYAAVWKALGVRRWIGVDISLDTVAYLRDRFSEHEFAAVDVTSPNWGSLEQDPGQFSCGLVTGIDLLYHVVDDYAFGAALKNLARFVRTGGFLVVSDVFPESIVQVAAHVRRRPIRAYEDVLAPLGFSFVGRTPVFGVMGDPVRSNGIVDAGLFQMWRLIQKIVRLTPKPFRNIFGAAVAWLVMPADAAVRSSGVATGRNLELVAFQRRTDKEGRLHRTTADQPTASEPASIP